MGSKNLKAIVVNGTKRVDVADRKRFKAAEERSNRFTPDPVLKDYMDSDLFKRQGKMPFFDSAAENGIVCQNWTAVYPPEAAIAKYGAKVYFEKVKRESVGCPGCPHPCKEAAEIQKGEYQGLKSCISSVPGRLRDFGVRCGVEPLERALKCIDVANRFGIDAHVFCPLMDYAVELYERGIITKRDMGGLVLKRDFETAMKLMEQVTFRQGIGEVLGDGFRAMVNRFGREAEKYAAQIKGLPLQQDARTIGLMMVTFGAVVDPEGAGIKPAHGAAYRVGANFSPEVVRNSCAKGFNLPRETIDRIMDVPYGYNVARLTRYGQDLYITLNCLGICDHRTRLYNFEILSELYSSVTGIEVSTGELQQAATRIWDMYKALNVREGFGRKDDKMPEMAFPPLRAASGREYPLIGGEGKAVSPADFDKLLDDYYEERGWDVKRGVPTRERLVSLGLA